MRLMSYIRLHPKTGIYQYRRPVPDWLKGRAPPVIGFPDNPNRAEWTKSLGARRGEEARANRLAAELDGPVEAAIAAAKDDVAAASPTPIRPVAPSIAPLSSAPAFAAIERWEEAAREAAERRLFNGNTESNWIETAGSDDPERDYHLQQFGHYTRNHADLWQRVPGFDDALVAALATQDIAIPADHPAIPRLRSAFAVAWVNVLTSINHMRSGVWDWRPEPEPSKPAHAASAKPGMRLDAKVVEWRVTLDMRERQKDMYVRTVQFFAKGMPEVDTETISKDDIQRWVTTQLTSGLVSMQTIKSKLSAIRLYWKYMKAHGHTSHTVEMFYGLYMRDVAKQAKPSQEKQGYRPEDVVKLWKAARAKRGSQFTELAKLIKLASFTGGRIESLCDLQADAVTVDPHTKVRVIRFNDKTEAGNRQVPIPDAFAPFVDDLIRNVDTRDMYLIKVKTKSKYGERSGPPGKLYGRLKRALGFGPEHDFHSFRRTVATLLERSHCPENFAADILGHEKKTITYGLYSDKTDLAARKAWMDKAIVYPDQEFMTA